MPYMGIQELKDANVKSGSATGDGSTTTFAIGWTPPSAGSLFVTINGVLQSASAYSISASNCVFTAAPVSADAIEFKGIQSSGTVVTLGDGVVNAAQLGSSSVVTASILDNNVTTAKILDNNVTLAKMAGLARGKIIVGDASGDPAALTVGASTQVLTSDGTDAAWATPASTTSDIELLNTYTPSGVSEVVVDTAAYFSSTYKGLKFKFINMHPITDNVHLRFQLGIGATPVYTGANFYTVFGISQSNGTTNNWQFEGSYGGSGNWGSNFATLFKEIGNDTDESVGGELELFNPGSSTFETVFQSQCSGHLYHDYFLTCYAGGGYNVSDAITGIRFYFNSGNIDSGIIKVYGLR